MTEPRKFMRRWSANLAAVLVLLMSAASADELAQSNMRFERIGTDDGLSQSAVMGVVQDETGFLWFATESGLDRYDGYGFRNYRHERGNASSLSNNFVRDLAIGRGGVIWAATDGGGLSRWNPQTDTFQSWRHDPLNDASISSDRVRVVAHDPRGYVWIGTREDGLDRMDTSTGDVVHYRHDPGDSTSLSNDEIYAIAVAPDGDVWVGTRSGLNRLAVDSGTFRLLEPLSETAAWPQDAHVRALQIDSQGSLWIGTHQAGLYRYVPSSRGLQNFRNDPATPTSLSSNRVEVLFEDIDGRIWIGTDRGLNLFKTGANEFYRYANNANDTTSLSDDFVFSIFQDRGGILWIGTRTGGANKWNPRSWTFGHFRPRDGDVHSLSNPNVTSFAEDRLGRTWVGTFGGGIDVFERGLTTVTHIRHDPEAKTSLSDDRVMAMLTARDGTIWVGTMRGGLNRIDPDTLNVSVYRSDAADASSLAADGVMSLFEDRLGRIWVGTFGGGVSRFRPRTNDFVNIQHDPANAASLSSNRATSIVEDQTGAIWVGTDGGGLNRSVDDGASWERLTHNNDDAGSLSANTIYALHVDANNTLWVGTRNGLDKIFVADAKSAQSANAWHRVVPGVVDRTIYSMAAEANGNLWMGTEHGLVTLQPDTGDTRIYHSEQGLQGDEFNFGAGFASRSGELFFGGGNGFNRFDPAKLKFNVTAPAIALTSFDIWNDPAVTSSPYESLESIDLGYRDDSVSFEFTALDFEAPERNRYSYQLVGFDDDWVDAGSERRVTYTNLAGGDYTFRVRAAIADGDWAEGGLSIPVHVALAPWETWWAYLSYVVVFAALISSMFYRQHRKLQQKAEQSRRLEHEVLKRTKQLNERNSDLREVNDQLIRLSTTDVLTGLRNRRYLFEKVTKDVDLVLRRQTGALRKMDMSENTDLLFLMVDLDNFKPVNDAYGHEAGDALLRQICEGLVESCRASDDIIRWGGDEFLVVARDANPVFAATLAERIRSNLAQRLFSIGDNRVVRISASIGYASFPFIKEKPDLLLWEEVLGIADAAMYEAKKHRNSWMGIEGIAWSGSGQELHVRTKQEPARLAAEGHIRLVESVKQAEAYSQQR